ncbi:unnamed protein product [Rhizophagus irregularis]|nr:unnamed protein product [Rhizophagus irregularis]
MTDVRCHAKNLYQECWLQDPMLRPTTEEVFNNLESIPIDSATELPILQHLIHLQKNTMIVLANLRCLLILTLQHLNTKYVMMVLKSLTLITFEEIRQSYNIILQQNYFETTRCLMAHVVHYL